MTQITRTTFVYVWVCEICTVSITRIRENCNSILHVLRTFNLQILLQDWIVDRERLNVVGRFICIDNCLANDENTMLAMNECISEA